MLQSMPDGEWQPLEQAYQTLGLASVDALRGRIKRKDPNILTKKVAGRVLVLIPTEQAIMSTADNQTERALMSPDFGAFVQQFHELAVEVGGLRVELAVTKRDLAMARRDVAALQRLLLERERVRDG